ncbi:MAG: class II aldolase/adducin family protein [bacterium]
MRLGGVGQDPARYDGAGYGNLSARVGPFPGARGARPFLISATQTGGLRCFDADGICLVRRCDARRNTVESVGPAPPSSESLTHGALYDLSPVIRYVFHVHSPVIWQQRDALRLPTSRADVAYGTPDMAFEVARLARETPLLDRGLLAMAGHEDGIIAFGRTASAAGAALVTALAEGHQRTLATTQRLCFDR